MDGTHEAVGTNVEYARYVELGTSRHAEKPGASPQAQGAPHRHRQHVYYEG
ncbi:MAG: hypothetical protein ACI362_04405 [Coriobacteriales bacterium]